MKRQFEIGGLQLVWIDIQLEGRMPGVLTPAESEVAVLLLMGRSDREIARHRNTRERTVANQVQAIYTKLGMSSRAELADYLALHVVAG